MKHESLWASIEKELACALPAHAISTWFDPISPLGLSGGELVLEVPNQFFYEWIESHYKQNLKRAISVVTDETIKHRLVVSTGKTDLNTGGNGVFPQSQIETKYPKPNINKNYLFESFIEGANNQFAKTAAEAVAEDLAPYLAGEQAQTIAVILAFLDDQRAATLLEVLPAPRQLEVIERLATCKPVGFSIFKFLWARQAVLEPESVNVARLYSPRRCLSAIRHEKRCSVR